MLSFLAQHGTIKVFDGRFPPIFLVLWLVLWAVLFQGMPGQCHGGSQEDADIIQNRITKQKQKIQKISREESRMMDELDSMGKKLFQSREKARALAREINALHTGIQEYSRKRDALIQHLESNREYLAQRLNAIYRLKGTSQDKTPDSLFDFLVTRDALHRILRADMAVMEEQAKGIAQLEQIQEKLARDMALESDKKKELEERIRQVEADSEEKKNFLNKILREKDLALAALKSLEIAAKELDKAFESLDIPARKEIQTKGFAARKGRLVPPVSGKILSSYGPTSLESGKGFYFQSGIDISAQQGTPVCSVFKGEVIYADWLQGYGNIVIVNHYDHYYSLYAHVEEMIKKTGDQVKTGEMIATIGDTGSMKGPCLHFEIRHHGKPVNPVKWLQKGEYQDGTAPVASEKN